jgi:hypothetical protein
MTWQNTIETKKKKRREEKRKGINAKRREIPITLMGFIFCFLETDNTRKQPFYRGVSVFLWK